MFPTRDQTEGQEEVQILSGQGTQNTVYTKSGGYPETPGTGP